MKGPSEKRDQFAMLEYMKGGQMVGPVFFFRCGLFFFRGYIFSWLKKIFHTKKSILR